MATGGRRQDRLRWSKLYTFSCIRPQVSLDDEQSHSLQGPGYSRVVHCNQPKLHQKQPLRYPTNYISTTKYNFISFIPKAIFEQFRRVANLYFLLAAILSLTPVTPFSAVSMIAPLAFVVGLSMAKEALEDWRRFIQDVKINSHKVSVHKGEGHFGYKHWQKLRVGDIVKVEKDQFFPADLLLLSSSYEDGICYVETMNLDGETNLKVKRSLEVTLLLDDDLAFKNFTAIIRCEDPNPNLYTFVGNFEYKQQVYALDPSQILLRDSKLRNTTYVYGVVIFTGHDSKVMQNATRLPSKRSKIEKKMDKIIYILFTFLLLISLFSSVGYAAKTKFGMPHWWYLQPNKTSYIYNASKPALSGFYHLVTALILYGYLIPISLYVSIEVVKVLQVKFINHDVHMCDEEIGKPAQARTSNLNEELGQVATILSDKTGTLTCNQMDFLRCSIAGVSYGVGSSEVEIATAKHFASEASGTSDQHISSTQDIWEDTWGTFGSSEIELVDGKSFCVKKPRKPTIKGFSFEDDRLMHGNWVKEPNVGAILLFFQILALCHTAIPESNEKTGGFTYEAESPDEATFLVAASEFGFEFSKRTQSSVFVRERYSSFGNTIEREFKVLNLLEFNSRRKRMSIIVRDESGQIILLCKGADSIILDRLSKNGRMFETDTIKHLNEYGEAGLRTLALAFRLLEESEYSAWNAEFLRAKTSMGIDREAELERVSDIIEQDLILVGATAVEDKLQKGVPQCIDKLAQAGLKIWVLTGDKMETAINIGFACSLLRQGMKQICLYLESNNMSARDSMITSQAAKDNILMQINDASQLIKLEKDPNAAFALIIDGKTLTYCLEDDLKNLFLSLAVDCASVICCRVSPKQKALVTRLVKEGTGKTTLAIGDGANDVGMIQEADIGVGISGVEGMQAVMASDFSISQFRFLERLLVVHGHWCYKRIAQMICYFFYKNIAFGLTIFYFEAYTGFSGQSVYDDWYMLLFNVILTSLPVISLGVFEQDVSSEICLQFPALYQQGPRNLFFDWYRILGWMGNGIYSSIIVYFLNIHIFYNQAFRADGQTADMVAVGTAMFTCIIWAVNLQIALTMSHFTWIQHLFVWGSVATWYIFLVAYGMSFLHLISGNSYQILLEVLAPAPMYWAATLLVTLACNIPYLAHISFQRALNPLDHHVIQEIKYYKKDVEDQRMWKRERSRARQKTKIGLTVRVDAKIRQLREKLQKKVSSLFKTGLMSVIKQKRARKDGASFDREHDIEYLWEFYKRFKRHRRVDDIQKEQERWRESGTYSTEIGARALEMKKVYATLKALLDVLEVLVGDSDTSELGRRIKEEVRKMGKSDATLRAELTPYNIVPVDAPSLTNAISFFPEIKAAISAIRYPSEFPRFPADLQVTHKKTLDMFDLLEFVFGFQKDNIRNQRENVILALANAQARLGLSSEMEPKVDEKAISEVLRKVLDNYIKWCKYLGIRVAWNSLEALNKNRKIILISLYYLIWGEAANARFLPECICYIFHNMAKELDAILDSHEASSAKSCICSDGSVSYLEQVICPIYNIMKAEADRNNNGKAAHSAWRNYDDFNEFFWSPSCFELSWPLRKESPFLLKPNNRKRTGKTGFVEHRTFLHLYRSFHRLWIFLFLMFQVLAIIAFHDGHINLNSFKVVLSVGPAFFILLFIESCLDVLLMFGAYRTTRGFAISRLFIRFVLFGCSTAFLTYLYVNVLDERNKANSDSTYFRIYILVLGVYAAVRLTFATLVKIPACHSLSDLSDRWPFFQFFKWIYQERYFVGRGLFEKTSDFARYVFFWLIILACKFVFAYYLQIKPLVEPTRAIVDMTNLQYSWHDFVSKGNHNALTVLSLWAPIFAIYLMDIHIWYTLLSALVGGLLGALARLGEIRSLDMFHKRFESFPEAFVKNLVSSQKKSITQNRLPAQESNDTARDFAAKFSPFWNEIIKSLREEDYINNREMDLLSIPSNSGSWRLVQWPLFLLTSKIPLAIDLALDCKDTQDDLWNRISKDKYMAYAVKEVFYSSERILHYVFDGEGRWVEKLFRELNNSISQGSLVVTITLKKLQLVLSRFSALTGLLIRDETPELAAGASKAAQELYDVITHDLLTSNLREQFDTWQILARERNQGHFFSKISWPRDEEFAVQVKRLHLLLTVKDSAANIPKNLEARRRLQFFANSLFMDMPSPKPVSEMIPFCVFTPYYSETVLFSKSELKVENEDGISILFYLQKIYPDEWENFLERIKSTADAVEDDDSLELRFWASYRGQTLARTVRGMMYYRRALVLQSYLEKRYRPEIEDGYSVSDYISTQGYELSPEARAQADIKFTYVVSCQIYGQQKQKGAPEAADILLLMQRNEALRIAFIHVEEKVAANGQVTKEFYSKLVKANDNGQDQEIYSVKLPGDPKLGEGKPENQNHAIIFTRGDAIQTIDMNQDNYLEEAMKMRNLLEEFHGNHGLRAPTILGVREHVFTGSVSSLAWFMSNQETSFVTLGQRVLAYPLKVRMHYGHPDVFDRIFHITRGGVSKASRVINISEDIYAGFNSTLRQGNITHHEYIQVGKGRDVGLNQIALFEGKVAGGNGEQVLSRDVYRLGQLFDFFRMLSFFFTTVGYYVCTMMTVLTIYIFLYGRVYLALSGLDSEISRKARISGNTALDAALNAQFLVQIGVFTAVPMIIGFILELGLMQAVFSFITMQFQLCAVFFTFSLGTRTHYFGRTILHGGAKYKATGRGFVVRHIKFAENYRLYSRSHFVKALEVALLLIVYISYGYTSNGASSFILLTISSWILVISWLFAPYIFNPSGFEWQKTVEDFDDWTAWLLYKGGVGIKGEYSWESWWDEEQSHIQTLRGRILETILSLRFFIFQYGIVYKLRLTGSDTSLAVYGFSWLVLFLMVLIFKVFTVSPKKTEIQLMMRFTQGVTAIALIAGLVLVVALTRLTIPDLFACALAVIPTGWLILSLTVTWKTFVKRLGLLDSLREIARLYDAGMGAVIFVPVAFLSWFPFVSTFQSRLLFNQAFSRGLEISLILAGNKANVQA